VWLIAIAKAAWNRHAIARGMKTTTGVDYAGDLRREPTSRGINAR
jgi:hypothetical protein